MKEHEVLALIQAEHPRSPLVFSHWEDLDHRVIPFPKEFLHHGVEMGAAGHLKDRDIYYFHVGYDDDNNVSVFAMFRALSPTDLLLGRLT